MAETTKKNTGRKAPAKKTASAKKPAVKETKPALEVKADEIEAIDENGKATALTDLAPELKGETVEVPIEAADEQPHTMEVQQEQTAPQQAVLMVAPKEPSVKIIYIDSVDPSNQIPLGNGKIITGPGKIFTVPLSYFEGEFQNPFRMGLLQERKLIVLDGLDEEQREQYGVNYKEGEVITKMVIFDYLIRCDTEKAVELFENLCVEHRAMAASKFNEAYEKGDNRISREKIEALNAISKHDYEDGRGAFGNILEAMNRKAV